jgi:hypothetical protein
MIDKLIQVQRELKVAKNNYNSFGKYNYRSCEDILEAVKPLLSKAGLCLTITDAIEAVGGRVYVKATATVTDGTGFHSVSAYAREPESRKGMDDAQVTGATSSYARKYALNGLFCIDDTKDADSSTPAEKIQPAANMQAMEEYYAVFRDALSMADLQAMFAVEYRQASAADKMAVVAAKDIRKKELTDAAKN